ncbi:MAG: thioredoxin TrxC [Candidatus Sericytochromatia bacterium]|nr:thioredoxin TrxC [Candidatus Sericytochromatia bacterium]
MTTDVQTVTYHCVACGTQNRLQTARLAEDPKCGKCGEKIFPRQPVTVTDATWQTEVIDSPIPVLVDFWAPWCGPCKALAPTLEQIAATRAGKLKIAKLNTEENPRTAGQFNIRSIPTLTLMRQGRPVDTVQGAMPKTALDAWLSERL